MRTTPGLLLLACLLVAPIVACNGPFILLPGAALEGSTAPVPESWAFTDEGKTIQLETGPADPYSVVPK